MTGHTDWRAQRYAATRSPEWLEGYRAFSVMGIAEAVCPWLELSDWLKRQDFLVGWQCADDDYEFGRDRAREDRQHYPASPMSAFERNRP